MSDNSDNTKNQISIFWFRRDLRLEDNAALSEALRNGQPVLPIFIFDTDIIDELPPNDPRLGFIHSSLEIINQKLLAYGSSLHIFKGKPLAVFEKLLTEYTVKNLFFNRDYEPYALKRDYDVAHLLSAQDVQIKSAKDQVIFEPNEILKADGNPYIVYTPFKKMWLAKMADTALEVFTIPNSPNFVKDPVPFPTLVELGMEKSDLPVYSVDYSVIDSYDENRDFPDKDGTSYLGPHLRFGTVSVRSLVPDLVNKGSGHAVFLSELIWREFFMHIMYYFPKVVHQNFRSKYDGIQWRNNTDDFEKWCTGNTGYPIVDAGMRQLNKTGYMHNRVRMVTAGFLCKHLLIDWRWGEAYFAQKLMDYDLSANNGNWQWAAGTGCDAAPYFRIFNPTEQVKKFDSQLKYIQKWVPELNSLSYQPMVEHKMARLRALDVYKSGILH